MDQLGGIRFTGMPGLTGVNHLGQTETPKTGFLKFHKTDNTGYVPKQSDPENQEIANVTNSYLKDYRVTPEQVVSVEKSLRGFGLETV